ncbi:MAG: hypothetical protein CMQ54_03785 [Gammaproteobacteria bacterium]|nr:hypothetical protein [Gammaproteobacteria bacterium]
MRSLNFKNITHLPEYVQLPKYDRKILSPGIVHLGCGAFHRTHLMDFHEDTLEHQSGAWGVIGINLREPDIGAILSPQEGLYCRQLRYKDEHQSRLIGGLLAGVSVIHSNEKIRRQTIRKAIEIATAPSIKVISMTVTEKGYCHAPSTGLLQESHPDITHDVMHPRFPLSVPGFVLETIQISFRSNQEPPIFISCDNVPGNGNTLRNCVSKLAQQVCPDLLQRINNDVIFLNTMVDRIVPAIRKKDIFEFQSMANIKDAAFVVGEPYRMWVIEQDKRANLPDWSASGALIKTNVHDYELIKMRVVNGMQTALAHLGHLSNFTYMSDVFSNETFREFGKSLIEREILPNLPKSTSIKLDDYINETVNRLVNPAIRHQTAQIATDGSQKIRHRLLDPLYDAYKAGLTYDGLTIALSAWLYHIFKLSKDNNQNEITDPFLKNSIKIQKISKDNLSIFINELIKERTVFPKWIFEIPNLIEELQAIAENMDKQQINDILEAYLIRQKK